MNTNNKRSVMVILVAMITLLLVSGIILVREAPRFTTAKISGILIGKDWKTDFTHYIRISGSDFTCQPDDGKRWACQVMLEGKLLEMTASYILTPYQAVTGCTVVYDGKPVACEATLGYGWDASLLVNDDLGISNARMAELRAQKPLLYMSEFTWLLLGVAVAAVLAFMLTLLLLATLNKKPTVAFPILGRKFPVWAVCLATIIAAVVLSSFSERMLFVLPLGIGGSLIVGAIIVWLNNLHKKRGINFAHPLMWSAASLVILWVVNLVIVFSLFRLGIVD